LIWMSKYGINYRKETFPWEGSRKEIRYETPTKFSE
jgi:hypothetical protein